MPKIMLYPLVGLFLVVALWTGYFYYQKQSLPSGQEIQQTITSLPSIFASQKEQLPGVSNISTEQASQLIEQGKEQVGAVLGDAVQVATDSSKPLTQKALDYGRYRYCQQVVEEYESTN